MFDCIGVVDILARPSLLVFLLHAYALRRYLNLGDNELIGTVPSEVTVMTALKYVFFPRRCVHSFP